MLELIETEAFHDTIETCFKGDRYLYMSYHYESPASFDEAASFSAVYARDMSFRGGVFYAMVKRSETTSEVVGFACILNNCIWDFYVRAKHRDLIDQAWTVVREKMPEEFHIRLYDSNFRDINWLIQTKGAKPFSMDKRLFGCRSDIPNRYIKTGERQVYHLELSQIILNFTKTQ
jgi:hypothetical protein